MSNWDVIQVGSHVGDYYTDKVFHKLNLKTKAILIEPYKPLFDKLVKNCERCYPKHNFELLNWAISNTKGTITLYVPDFHLFCHSIENLYIEKGFPQWLDQLGSVNKNHVEAHGIDVELKEIKVKCVTLNDLIQLYNITSLNELHIDTEGHDYEVLEGLNFNLLKPKKIVFEHKHIEGSNQSFGQKYNNLIDRLVSFDYQIIDSDSNDTTVVLK